MKAYLRKVFIVSFILLLFSGILNLTPAVIEVSASWPPAQEWSQTYGSPSDDSASDIVECSDGGFIVAGETNRAGNVDR